MSFREKNNCLIDFCDDRNSQFCALASVAIHLGDSWKTLS